MADDKTSGLNDKSNENEYDGVARLLKTPDDSTSGLNDNLVENKWTKERETYIECTVCNIEFDNDFHYNNHLDTKTHKRNIREKESDIANSPNQPDITDNYIEDRESCYKRERKEEEYKKKKFENFGSNYTSYVWSVTAYWASVLVINPTVKDFKISLFDQDWGNFGDAVIEIEFVKTVGKESVKRIFAIQFKHLSNNITTLDRFDTVQFNFQDIISKMDQIKAKANWDDVKFVVYTTAAISPELKLDEPVCMQVKPKCKFNKDQNSGQQISNIQEGPVYIKALSAKTKSIIDTSDYTQIIYYFYSATNDSVLPRIHIHTSQKRRSRYFPSSINELFFTVLKDESVKLSQELIKFVENWRMEEHLGTYKLKKEDVLEKLGELLLYKFIVTPKVKYSDPPRSFTIWLQAVNTTHVTVLKDPVRLSEICEPMNLLIEEKLGVHIDITSQTVNISTSKKENDIKIKSDLLKAYIFEETVRNSNTDYVRISMEKIYLIFWKLGLTHLILEVSTLKKQEYVLRVTNWLKSVGLNRRYFLKTSDVNIKKLVKPFTNLSFFVSLDDVVEKLDPSMLVRVKIYVTDEFALNLKTIRESDRFFQKNISANEFFDMTLGKYFMKPCGGSFTRGRADDLKLILSEDLLETLRSQVQSKINGVRQESNAKNHRLRGINPKLFE